MRQCTGDSVIKRKDSLCGAVHEIKDEFVIDIDKNLANFIDSTLRHYEECPDILDVWLCKCDVELNNVKIQKEEVCNIM